MMVEVTTDGREVWINADRIVSMEAGNPLYSNSTVIWFEGDCVYLVVDEKPQEIALRIAIRSLRPCREFLGVS